MNKSVFQPNQRNVAVTFLSLNIVQSWKLFLVSDDKFESYFTTNLWWYKVESNLLYYTVKFLTIYTNLHNEQTVLQKACIYLFKSAYASIMDLELRKNKNMFNIEFHIIKLKIRVVFGLYSCDFYHGSIYHGLHNRGKKGCLMRKVM